MPHSMNSEMVRRYQRHDAGPRLCHYKPRSIEKKITFAAEAARSLERIPRSLNPKFFYNKTGSMLFDQICQLPEYYLTRTEIKILQHMQDEIPQYLPVDYRLVELGSGSAVKTRLILDVLDRLQERVEFFPIDVSDILDESSLNLLESYPNLYITGVIDTFESGLEFIKRHGGGPNLIAFLGSSLGNFESHNAQAFLEQIAGTMREEDLFLLGLDLVKDRCVLEQAYNDSQGVTARFNLNVLQRINDELDGDFVLDDFAHHCIFNQDHSRIEMHLRSKREQTVNIPRAGLKIHLRENELIHTEHSHKYTIPRIKNMMQSAGLDTLKIWQDSEFQYCVVLASRI